MSTRGERRREERERLRMGVSGAGEVFPAENLPERMPVKSRGRHRWTVIASFTVTDNEAAQAAEGVSVVMDAPKLAAFNIVCIDCEEVYEKARTEPCPAGDQWYPPDHPKHRDAQ